MSTPFINPAKERISSFAALKHRNFRVFLTGQFVSLTGTWVQSIAQSWLLYRLTKSELILGLASFATHLPMLLLGLAGGVAADRFDRRKVVLVTQTLFLVQATVMAALTLTGVVQVWHVLVLAIFFGIVNAFDVPARQSLLIHMADRKDLLSAVALNSAAFNSARAVGPSLGGIAVAAVGEGLCFAINAVSFLCVLISLSMLRLPLIERSSTGDPMDHLRSGLRYAWGHHEIKAVLALCGAVTMSIAPMIVLGPFFADQIFHVGSKGLGFLMAAFGVGAVLGTLTLAHGGVATASLPRVAMHNSFGLGLALIAMAFAPNFTAGLIIMLVSGFAVFRQNAAANTFIQQTVEEEFRGRVLSLYSIMAVGMMPVGSLAAGLLAHQAGARVTVGVGGVVVLLAATRFFLSEKNKTPADSPCIRPTL